MVKCTRPSMDFSTRGRREIFYNTGNLHTRGGAVSERTEVSGLCATATCRNRDLLIPNFAFENLRSGRETCRADKFGKIDDDISCGQCQGHACPSQATQQEGDAAPLISKPLCLPLELLPHDDRFVRLYILQVQRSESVRVRVHNTCLLPFLPPSCSLSSTCRTRVV